MPQATRNPTGSLVATNTVTSLSSAATSGSNQNPKKPPSGSASSPDASVQKSWAFWSKQKPSNSDRHEGELNEEDSGELAVIGTESEHVPIHAREPEEDFDEPSQQASSSPPERKQKHIQHPPRPNLVVPSIEDSLPKYIVVPVPDVIEEKPPVPEIKKASAWQRIKNWWFSSDIQPSNVNEPKEPDTETPPSPALSATPSPPPPEPLNFHPPHNQFHQPLYRTASPAHITSVVVIGVHGFFPMRALRSVLGEPTGTSVKFANEGGAAFERWALKHNPTLQIEKIALEGEGKVLDRVEDLYTLMLNWITHIKKADCVFFAAHSQGTPVAVHLLARLIEDGHVDASKRLGLLGMAGVSLGPFNGFDQNPILRAYSTVENASLRELFQFKSLRSSMGTRYIESLHTIIGANAKLIFIGSMNDQVVPLYSATCTHVSHPNIYRAAYVDGTEVAPEFIADLVALALLLRNIGSTDHALIKEISDSLTGSLRGKGHSNIYNEPAVYDLAIQFLLQTTDAVDPHHTPSRSIPLQVDYSFHVPKLNNNPFLLPWALHGLVTEAASRPSLNDRLVRLVNDFASWTPESKPLKDIKYRLAAVQSKL